jgi:hypothetical protein
MLNPVEDEVYKFDILHKHNNALTGIRVKYKFDSKVDKICIDFDKI